MAGTTVLWARTCGARGTRVRRMKEQLAACVAFQRPGLFSQKRHKRALQFQFSGNPTSSGD